MCKVSEGRTPARLTARTAAPKAARARGHDTQRYGTFTDTDSDTRQAPPSSTLR